jgi:hypothetical protein
LNGQPLGKVGIARIYNQDRVVYNDFACNDLTLGLVRTALRHLLPQLENSADSAPDSPAATERKCAHADT